MSEAKHSPLPWAINTSPFLTYCSICQGQAKEPSIVVTADYGKRICRVGPRATKAGRIDAANAAFITLACNSHYELVEALRGLISTLPAREAMLPRTEEAFDAARAALAKAGVKP